jgi:hypothetical protein
LVVSTFKLSNLLASSRNADIWKGVKPFAFSNSEIELP